MKFIQRITDLFALIALLFANSIEVITGVRKLRDLFRKSAAAPASDPAQNPGAESAPAQNSDPPPSADTGPDMKAKVIQDVNNVSEVTSAAIGVMDGINQRIPGRPYNDKVAECTAALVEDTSIYIRRRVGDYRDYTLKNGPADT